MSDDMSFHLHRNAAARHPRRPRQPDPEITHTVVNRALWAEALRLADGDPRRIRIISATKVEIT